MNAKRLAFTLVVVVSLVAMGSGAAAGAVSAPADGGAGAEKCAMPYADTTDDARSEVGTDCTGGGGCLIYCLP